MNTYGSENALSHFSQKQSCQCLISTCENYTQSIHIHILTHMYMCILTKTIPMHVCTYVYIKAESRSGRFALQKGLILLALWWPGPLHSCSGISAWPPILQTFLVDCPKDFSPAILGLQFIQTEAIFSRMGRK